MIMICFSLPTASTMPHHQVSSLVTSERVLETESEFKYLRVDFDIYEFLTHYYRHNISMCSDIMSGQIKHRMNSKCICFLSICIWFLYSSAWLPQKLFACFLNE